jgi:hypothetical protein
VTRFLWAIGRSTDSTESTFDQEHDQHLFPTFEAWRMPTPAGFGGLAITFKPPPVPACTPAATAHSHRETAYVRHSQNEDRTDGQESRRYFRPKLLIRGAASEFGIARASLLAGEGYRVLGTGFVIGSMTAYRQKTLGIPL